MLDLGTPKYHVIISLRVAFCASRLFERCMPIEVCVVVTRKAVLYQLMSDARDTRDGSSDVGDAAGPVLSSYVDTGRCIGCRRGEPVLVKASGWHAFSSEACLRCFVAHHRNISVTQEKYLCLAFA